MNPTTREIHGWLSSRFSFERLFNELLRCFPARCLLTYFFVLHIILSKLINIIILLLNPLNRTCNTPPGNPFLQASAVSSASVSTFLYLKPVKLLYGISSALPLSFWGNTVTEGWQTAVLVPQDLRSDALVILFCIPNRRGEPCSPTQNVCHSQWSEAEPRNPL